jgi:hypothetical protein
MNPVRLLLLAAVFAAPLHAQECSGGGGGGVDATGNQCSDAAASRATARASGTVSYVQSAKMSGVEHRGAVAAIAPQPSAKLAATPARPILVAQGKSRFVKAAMSPYAPLHTSKIEGADASPCSGGADGGADATGNQCGAYTAAGPHLASTVSTKP